MARGSSGARHRLQGLFVVVEMAMALVLLVGAGLMVRSLAKLWSVDPGFHPHNLLTFAVSCPTTPGAAPDAIRASMQQLQDTVAAVPGVEAAALNGGAIPMTGDSEVPFWIEGQPKPATDSEMKTALFYIVEPDYLKAMGISLERGRFLTPATMSVPGLWSSSTNNSQGCISRAKPNRPTRSTSRFSTRRPKLGIVGHVKQWGLAEDAKSPVLAQFYMPVSQVPDQFMPLLARGGFFVARTQGSPEIEIDAVRRALQKLNGEIV